MPRHRCPGRPVGSIQHAGLHRVVDLRRGDRGDRGTGLGQHLLECLAGGTDLQALHVVGGGVVCSDMTIECNIRPVDAIRESLEQSILLGEISAGTRLDEHTVAERFSVSRTRCARRSIS